MRLNPIFQDMPVTIFEIMSGLARDHDAINLGQGFPDAPGPEDLRRLAADAVMTGSNQYAPSRGLGGLRAAVVEHYARLQDISLTVEGVCVTSGATEALAAAVLAVVRPGDEVIVFEPTYDAYRPLIERAGGTVRAVRLTPPHWRITPELLAQAVGPATRALMFNSPHNPTGRAFDTAEIAAVASLCVAHDLIAISDEVWEHVIFDGRRHLSLLAQPGMAERTIKIGSAGKMFGLTGWKIGFACGAPDLIDAVAKAHQFLTFATPPNLQSAVAAGLAWPQARFDAMRADLGRPRDRLTAGLEAQGYVCAQSEGTYFLCLDLAASGVAVDDMTFCRRLVTEFGVAAIPVSNFVDGPETSTPETGTPETGTPETGTPETGTPETGTPETGAIVRLCFAKANEVLDEAIRRLGAARFQLS